MDKRLMYDLLVEAIQTQATVVNITPAYEGYNEALAQADEAMIRLVTELEKLESN